MHCLSRCCSKFLGYGGWTSHALTYDSEETNKQTRIAAQGQEALRTMAGPGPGANIKIPENKQSHAAAGAGAGPGVTKKPHSVLGGAAKPKTAAALEEKAIAVVAALPVEREFSDEILSPAIKCRVNEIAKNRIHKDERYEQQPFAHYFVDQKKVAFLLSPRRPCRPYTYIIGPNEFVIMTHLSSQLYNKIEKVGKTLIAVELACKHSDDIPIMLTTQNAKDIVAQDQNRVVIWKNNKIIYCHHAGLVEPIKIRFPYKNYLQLEVLVELIAKGGNIDDHNACREAIAKAEAEEREFNSVENTVKRQKELRSEIIAEVIAEEEAFRAQQGSQGLRHRVSHVAAGAGAGSGPGYSTALVASHAENVWAS